ncbi:MAG: alcohol dehydrogenase catalytic domain-containing protein [Thermoguttaceae bacterium]
MKAIVYYAPGDIRYEDAPKPVCGVGEILLKIDACAVCGTDLKSKSHGNPRIKAPLIMGHEFTGIVADVCADVGANAESGVPESAFKIGDRVVMATSVSCGNCAYCKRGFPNLCQSLQPMGFSFPGGMAEYTAIPALALKNGHAVKVPSHVKPEHAALAEPVSCAVNSVNQCRVLPGDVVVVMGAGPMGILNALVAKSKGARTVILSEVNPQRLKQATPFGLERLVNPATENLLEIVKAETDGLGADVVIVAAPAAAPQEQALSLVRKQGTVCLFASLPVGKSDITIDSRILHYGEIRMIGTSDSTPAHVKEAVDLLANGAIQAEKIASHTLPLSAIDQAFDLMTSGESLRVVLVP